MDDPRGVSAHPVNRGLDFHRNLGQTEPGSASADVLPSSDRPIDPRMTSAIDEFALRIHASLNPEEVIATAVHELRPILGCERINFLERTRTGFRLVAASGHAGLPRRSRPAAMLEQFVSVVLDQKERFQFPDQQMELPEEIARRLDDYWELSNGQFILVEPIFSAPSRSTVDSNNQDDRSIAGALVVEQFSQPSLPTGGLTVLDAAVKHLAPALKNCRTYWRLASIPGLSHCGRVAEIIRGSMRMAVAFYVAITALLIAAAAIIHQPFEIECRGRLMPTQRREVFSAVEGEVVDVAVRESQSVEAGQVLCQLQSRELEKAIIEQTGLLKGKLKARDAARAELRSKSTPQARNQSSRDQAQLELINAEIDTIQRQLKVLEQEESQLQICSPISGIVMTERPEEKLRGRPVRRGEPLIEILQDEGGWQLELAVAERRLGHLLAWHKTHPRIKVKFRPLSSVTQSYECQITRMADRTVPSGESGSTCQVYCDVSNVNQLTRQVGSEVSARIQCGRRSLLYIWFHDFWELLQRNWIV